MPQKDIWRQATENNARDDLNAIARARQFALLLMDVLRQDGEEFRPLSDFEHEQDFYAQVADGEQHRIPRGKGGLLANAMNVNSSGQLRHYRRILRIPYALWDEADDHNWTEGEIRKTVESDDTVTCVTVSDQKSRAFKTIERSLSLLDKLNAKRMNAISDDERETLRNMLATYRRRLDDLDAWLD